MTNEEMTTETAVAETNEQQLWEAQQLRSAILLGLTVYHKRTEALRATGRASAAGQETDATALECATYAEAALRRLKSVCPAHAGLSVVAERLADFLAAETAAGRCGVLGYTNERGNWCVLVPRDFLLALVTAYNRRGEILRRRAEA